MPGVAKRVRSFLEERYEQIEVRLNHDKVGSDALRVLAKQADIFIMATASAKHAATHFIEQHRPKETLLVRPAGKGSASMIRALYDRLGEDNSRESYA